MLFAALIGAAACPAATQPPRPNIVLMMADDQGWGETGYNGHPYLKTPVLDEMARTGLRLDRFYAASPVCSPTRASVMTGRHANRSGAFAANWSTRPEEITIAQILQKAGYRTAHFGKWHLGPVKKDSPLNPSRMGFDEYLSHDNFFEMNPPLSRNGAAPEVVTGESSEVIVEAAVAFTRRVVAEGKPFLVVIHFGSPHDPYSGKPEDIAPYAHLGKEIGGRFAEVAAMDRAIGIYRAALDEMKARENTLVWFNSDNGISWEGIPDAQQKDLYNGGWRGHKESLYEGGVLVPGIIEWPAAIKAPRQSSVSCVTSDILPTVLDLVGLTHPAPSRPLDGISLKPLVVDGRMADRPSPIGFWKYATQDEHNNVRWIAEELSRGTTPTTRNPGILFHPSCSSDEIEAVCWKRTSGRAQQPVGPNSKIFHCVANTVGESPEGKQTSSGSSFIREPNGIPLAEAGYYQEEMITAVLDLERADRSYVHDSLRNPPFLADHWRRMVADVEARKDVPPE
jgi:arylsulfatase A-like enzyme